jgi:hypothetical protein
MCKKCEIRDIKMELQPLNLVTIRQTTALPKSWEALEIVDFHPDITDRAYAHLAWTERTGNALWIGNANAFLAALGKGFLEPFDAKKFRPKEGDPYFDLKTRALAALTELSAEFGDRVTSVMWNSLAHLATRTEPEESRSILKEADILPHHYGIVDTMLHAMGKVYTFSLRVQSVFFAHTGMVLVHNCDCNCSLLNLQPVNGNIAFELGEKQRFEATQSLMSHMCAESHLILNSKLPFEYTITGDAQAVLAACKVP